MLDGVSGEVMNRCREEAVRQFEALGGLPDGTEEYRYTDLKPIFGRDYHVAFRPAAKQGSGAGFRCAVPGLQTGIVLTENGWYMNGGEPVAWPEGMIVCGMREACLRYPELVAAHYNRHVPSVLKDGTIPLNTAFAEDGLFVYIPKNGVAKVPLQLVNLLRANGDLMAFQRNLVVLEAGAQATMLVCDHTLSEHRFLMNSATEVALGEGARLDYYRVQNRHNGASQVNTMTVDVGANASFESNIVTLYGGFVRNNQYVTLGGEGGECRLYGVYILDKSQHVDNFTVIDHVAPRCTSDEHFKGVMDDSSVADFAGCIRVAPGAEKTEAYQANNNLLLTDTARVNTKPQLIIDADDVKCSHGATVGQMDEEALFYLRSRGIGLAEARLMMMFGFAHDIVSRVKLEPLRAEIDKLIDKRFRGEFSKCHNCMMDCKKQPEGNG